MRRLPALAVHRLVILAVTLASTVGCRSGPAPIYWFDVHLRHAGEVVLSCDDEVIAGGERRIDLQRIEDGACVYRVYYLNEPITLHLAKAGYAPRDLDYSPSVSGVDLAVTLDKL